MTRPTRVIISTTALLHNLRRVKDYAPATQVIAMVKANAYGCGLANVVPALEGQVNAFGVACLEEAMIIRGLGIRSPCILFQGVFSPDELHVVAKQQFQLVLHQPHHLHWLLTTALTSKIKVWVKVDTGMHRLGFPPSDVYEVVNALTQCPWVEKEIGLITHLASADEPHHSFNQVQIQTYNELKLPAIPFTKSVANSAGIIAFPSIHHDIVRPGIMLYGVSPFANQTGSSLGLMPVMRFTSAITAIQNYSPGAQIGYGGTWKTKRPSRIGIIPVGYGDGYPRHVKSDTPVNINGLSVPIVGRISMDMLTVDLTDYPGVNLGDSVELWGGHLPVELIADSAGTIPYELLCQFSPRIRR